jgi:signal transduction histidine kinase/CheY-like chemotaxis protein
MTFLNLLLLRTELPFIVGGLVLTAVFGSFCGMTIFVKHEMHGLASLWIYSYPLMSIFTLGLPAGLIPALLLQIVAIAGTFGGLAKFDYTVSESALLCGVYLFVMILTVVYEYVRSYKDRWLARQDSYMKLVFDNSPDIIMLLDKNIGLAYCAKVFLQKANINTFEEIQKINYRDVFSRFINPEQLNEIINLFRSSREEMKPVIFEKVLDFGNNGHPRHYEIHFTPMNNDDNVFQGAFILFHDMTDIMEAKEHAEQASRAKSTFLANMSHEIRTPLNAIIGMTNIAKDSDDPDRKDYCLDKIESASVHLLGIINDILDMSKIEEDKFELSYTEFEFDAMIQRVVNIFEFRLGEKKQKLTVNQDPAIPKRIITDDQRLAQVITNLIGNAIKFTPEGGDITLSVQRLPDTDEGLCTIKINITDTGIGIPKEQQGKLFQSFVQVDSSIARKFGGTGLGLAISKKIIELMQGEIHIESEINKGSSFIFTIRAEIPDAASEEINDGKDVPDELPDFTGKRILLAEDVEINREIVITALEPLGLTIIEAEDGQKAYDLYCANPGNYDLIFMDIHMPGIDGWETTKLIRAFEADYLPENTKHVPAENAPEFAKHVPTETVLENAKHVPTADALEFAKQTPQLSESPKGIPIIAMTANVFKEDVEHCHAAGMNDHIGKPVDFNAVMLVLKKYLGNSKHDL